MQTVILTLAKQQRLYRKFLMSSARVSSIALESNYFTEERDDKKDHVLLCFHRKLMKFHKAKLAKQSISQNIYCLVKKYYKHKITTTFRENTVTKKEKLSESSLLFCQRQKDFRQ